MLDKVRTQTLSGGGFGSGTNGPRGGGGFDLAAIFDRRVENQDGNCPAKKSANGCNVVLRSWKMTRMALEVIPHRQRRPEFDQCRRNQE